MNTFSDLLWAESHFFTNNWSSNRCQIMHKSLALGLEILVSFNVSYVWKIWSTTVVWLFAWVDGSAWKPWYFPKFYSLILHWWLLWRYLLIQRYIIVILNIERLRLVTHHLHRSHFFDDHSARVHWETGILIGAYPGVLCYFKPLGCHNAKLWSLIQIHAKFILWGIRKHIIN